jgi:hypothetical protein
MYTTGKKSTFQNSVMITTVKWCGLHLKCDGTHAETRFRLSVKRTIPFKSAGVSVQLTIGSHVRIGSSIAGYTGWGSFSPSPPHQCLYVPSRFNWTLPYKVINKKRGEGREDII